jgi:tetratricopeptide (TPR) repeat protein
MERLSTMSHPFLLWDDAEKLVQGRDDLPGAYRIYYNRGTELNKMGRQDDAIADFNRTIALLPDFSPAYGNMGAAYLDKHEWKEAVNAFNMFIEVATEEGERLDMRPYYGRAMAYEELGMMDKAKLDYKESCRLGNKGCEKL